MKHNKGFTLIELMIIVAILGILVAVFAGKAHGATNDDQDSMLVYVQKTPSNTLRMDYQYDSMPMSGCRSTASDTVKSTYWHVVEYTCVPIPNNADVEAVFQVYMLNNFVKKYDQLSAKYGTQ